MSEIKKKKKRSLIQQMKKMNKRGSQGKGVQLPMELYTYYFALYEDFRKTVEKDMKDILIQRVLKELIKEDRVTDLAKNQLGSRILEEMLQEAPTKLVFSIIDSFSEDLWPLFKDQFASFVLQTLLKISFSHIQKGAMEKMENSEEKPIPIDETSKSNFIAFLLKVSKIIYNNLEDFIKDKYTSHILRTVLEICSGVEVSGPVKNKPNMESKSFDSLKEEELKVVEVPEALTSVRNDILERIKQLPSFEELILVDCVSATLQTALLILDGQKETEIIISLSSVIMEYGIMKLGNVNNEIHPVFNNQSSCRLMEVLLSVVPEKNQKLIYQAFFRDQMMKLVNHQIAWHAVDKLFASCKSKKLFTSLINTHTDCLKEAFLCRNCKILHSVAQSCRRLNICQNEFIEIIIKILEFDKDEQNQPRLIFPLLYLITWKDYEKKKESNILNILSYGCSILQEMLHFRQNNKVANSIVQLSCSEIMKLTSDPKASRIIDAFFSSPFVKENLKDDLYKKLKGNYGVMACNTYGSFIVEHIFNYLNLNMKTELCQELLQNSNRLKSSRGGLNIYNKFQLEHFNANGGKTWRETFEKLHTKKLFLTELKREISEFTLEKEKKEPPSKKRKKNVNR